MFLYMPIEKIESEKDATYRAMALRMLYLGKKAEAKENNTISCVELKDIYQAIFPKLYLDKIRMEKVTAFMEIDRAFLDQEVPLNFPDSSIEDKRKLFKDYLLNYRVKGDKALIFVAHRDKGYSRQNETSSEELYCFVDYFKNETISNIYVQEYSIKEKIEEYTDNETFENISKMSKSDIQYYMRTWGYDILMTEDQESHNFSTATKDELLNFISKIKV